MPSVNISDIAWDRIQRLAKLMNVSPEAIASDILNNITPLIEYFLARALVSSVDVCRDVVNPNVIDLRLMLRRVSGESRKDPVKEAIKRTVIYPAAFLLAIKLKFGRYPPSVRIDEVTHMLSKESLRYGPKALVAHGLAKLDKNTVNLINRSEVYDTFIDCAERLSAELRFGILRNMKKIAR
jgi:hypothetical protein